METETPKRSPAVPWQRFIVEGAVIVFGILIALGADAWWDGKIQRGEEQSMLRQLSAEFADNEVQLDSVLRVHGRGLDGSRELLKFVQGSAELTSDSVRVLLRVLDNSWTFNPKRGALESVLASGRLGIIQDDELRVALAGWPGVLEDYMEDEAYALRYGAGAQYEYMSSVVNWNDIYGPVEGRRDSPMDHLVGDEGLESIVAYRYSFYQDILAEANQVVEASGLIRALLERDLAGGG